MRIERGDYAMVVGKSGSGKSTLLNILTGLDRTDSGTISFEGNHLETWTESQFAAWRGRNVGIVFQFYQLLPSLTVLNNVLFSMDLVGSIPKVKRVERALFLLESMGLESKTGKLPSELSGGERQRVAIARALANDPPLLVADEPTGNLDSSTGKSIQELFAKLNRSGKTIIQVTHENVGTLEYNRLFKMEDGILAESL
ncbi:MAG: ABC transporter ATP-binding protein [Flavobacteriales bacterium]|nr:ABC transporter ATP-binding protein [Flavobacteriales bacterium]